MAVPRAAAALLATALSAGLLAAPVGAQDPGHRRMAATVTSPADGAVIDLEIYRPAGASAGSPVPVLLQGPGWSGTKTAADGAFAAYLDAGYGVVSITPRGFGESGGEVTIMDPDLEGRDYIAVLDLVAGLDWAASEPRTVDGPSGAAIVIDDPLVGAIGGSYGGGYQLLVALTELATKGYTRMDALSPQITWHDLNDALAPQGVPRSAWLTLLYAVGAQDVAPYVTEGFAYGVATGSYPDGSVPGVVDLEAELATHGPSGFLAQGIQLDIPVLLRQGFSDNLFNFNQGWRNFTGLLTDDAREASTLIGFNGGHALPNVLPMGEATGGDACVEDFTATEIAFFDAVFAGEDPRVVGDGEPFHYTTVDGDCLRLVPPRMDREVLPMGAADPLGLAAGTVVSPAAGGLPIHVPIPGTQGLTVAGVPTLTADLTGLGLDARAFLGLSRGTSPLDATVIQNNLLPVRATGGLAQQQVAVELPGLAVELADDEQLFLTVSPVSDIFFAHGSRTPGAVLLEAVEIDLPVVTDRPGRGHFTRPRD